ncbi:MAG: indole-3-glycerol phosphate synthase TrpC [Pseudobutyrivibrio sp.]|nr:indole-3-glycerol phosphate synthase TrpC [Pseudobutyrivibrio sp.]
MTILDQLAEHAKSRVEHAKKIESKDCIKLRAYELPKGDFEFEKALKKKGLSYICEVKKASPSKGIIAEDFDYISVAKDYEKAGADCISVLTEPKWFLGSDEYLREIAKEVSLPIIRKDFTVDEYMIYEAKLLGAKAVLLIVSLLCEHELKEYIRICDSLGMTALVEAHDEAEVKMALKSGARVIGVNNRNLNDFTVDTANSKNLKSLVSDDVIFISESGIAGMADIKALEDAGVDAVLIGEALMKAADKGKMLRELKGEVI